MAVGVGSGVAVGVGWGVAVGVGLGVAVGVGVAAGVAVAVASKVGWLAVVEAGASMTSQALSASAANKINAKMYNFFIVKPSLTAGNPPSIWYSIVIYGFSRRRLYHARRESATKSGG